MNLKEIRDECWDLAREVGTDDATRVWTKAEMNRYINRTYRDIARQTRCIRDATSSLCLVTVAPVDYTTYAAGTKDYLWANTAGMWLYQKNVCPYLLPLDPLILQVDEAKWTVKQWKLVKVSVTKWQNNPYWEQVMGMPTEFATDYQNNYLTLNFRAEDTDYLQLWVRRLPLTNLALDTDEPEFRSEYHDYFRNGVMAQMYRKQDAEIFDPQKAVNYEGFYREDLDKIKHEETKLDNRTRNNAALGAFR